MIKNLLLFGVIGLGLIIQLDGRVQQQTTPRNPGQSNIQERTQQPQTLPSTPQGTQRSPSQTPSQPAAAMTSESFVKKVAESNQMEIDMSRTASSRAKSAQVKDYAQQLVKDHIGSLDTLKKYASKHNITLSTGSTASSSATQSNPSNNRS